MRTHIANAFFGVLDYVAWPAGMLAVAPIAVRTLGVERYGIWMVANSVVSAGAIIASGFGDANIRYVAAQRTAGNHAAVRRSVCSSMAIHLALGSILAGVGWMGAPALTARLVAADSPLRADCLWSLRIACMLLLIRAVESVCIGTRRAFEQYGAAVGVSIAARMLGLAAAAVLPAWRPSVTNVLIAAGVISLAGLWIQLAQVAARIRSAVLVPRFDRESTRALLGFGKFTWILAVSALFTGQLDRLITGAALGAAAVSSYAMCVQLSQPVYGITAAGLHFLLPRITSQYVRNDMTVLRRTVLIAIAMNAVAVAAGSAILLLFGDRILHAWGGPLIARSSGAVLPIVLCGTALSALAIAGCYAMVAIGRVRLVTCLHVAGAAVMMGAACFLLPRYGVRGMALARIGYGSITLGVYAPILFSFARGFTRKQGEDSKVGTSELCGEA